MKIKKTLAVSPKPNYQDISHDFVRNILNHTEETLRIIDSSGRVRFIEPLPKHSFERLDNILIVEEWFYGSEITEEMAKHGILRTKDNYGIHNGVKVQHHIRLDDLEDLPDGIYIEDAGLHISVAKFESSFTNPKYNQQMQDIIDAHMASGIFIDILDPRRCINTMYVNLNGKVYPVVPRRLPTPLEEGVKILVCDGKGKTEEYLYPLQDILYGEGKHGVRLYTNEHDAFEDNRRPDKEAIQRLKEELRGHRDKIYNEGYTAAKESVSKVYEEKIKKIEEKMDKVTREAKAKMDKAQDMEDAVRKSRQNDKTGLWGNIVKLFGSILGFFKGIFV